MVIICLVIPQKSLNNLKNELGSVKGSKAEKEQEVERLTKDLMVNIDFSIFFSDHLDVSILFILSQAVRSEFSRVKSSLDKREREYSDQTKELKIAEDEIDELKKLLNVAKDIRRKSVGFLTDDQKKKQEEETPDGCKQQ